VKKDEFVHSDRLTRYSASIFLYATPGWTDMIHVRERNRVSLCRMRKDLLETELFW
jgi:hypothetical protein